MAYKTQRIANRVKCRLIDHWRDEVLTTECDNDYLEYFTVEDGKLTYDLTTDTKISGSITIAIDASSIKMARSGMLGQAEVITDFEKIMATTYVQLYISNPNNKGMKKIVTMLPSLKGIENNMGAGGTIYKGTLELKSTLCAYTENELRRHTIKEGTNVAAAIKKFVKQYAAGGLRVVKFQGISTSKLTNTVLKKNKVFKSGTTAYKELSWLAQKLNAYVTVDENGYTVIRGKQAGSVKAVFSNVPDDKHLALTSGVKITDNGTPTNRVQCYYEKTTTDDGKQSTKRYYGNIARLGVTDYFSEDYLDRNITKMVSKSENDITEGYTKKQGNNILKSSSMIKKRLTILAKEELKEAAEFNYTYEFQCPFVDNLKLRDKARIVCDSETYTVRVSSIDIDLFNGCEMTIKGTAPKAPHKVKRTKYKNGVTIIRL